MTTPHLDDEALSAALDGAATTAEEAHLSSCSQCRAQMSSLALVARAVGAPVPPRPPNEVDDAVERALLGWSQASPSPSSSPLEARPAPGVGPAPVRWDRPATSRPAKRGARPPRWLGAAGGIAAAVVVIAGVVALSRGISTKTSSTTSMAGSPARPTIASPSSSPFLPSSPADAAVGPDLGDQSDPAAVARLVIGAVAHPVLGAAASSPAASTIPTPGRSAAGSLVPGTACVAQAREATGLAADQSAVARFVAPVRWRGQPAVVVVFSRPGGLSGRVMKLADCSVLANLPL